MRERQVQSSSPLDLDRLLQAVERTVRADTKPMLHTEFDRGGYLRNGVAVCAGAGSGLRHLVAQRHSIEDAPVAEPRQVERLVAPVQ